jgi:predicted RNA-binding Zn-ribbon protein involved in translation (DUF1610 family)
MGEWYSCGGCGAKFIKEEWETYGCPVCGRNYITKAVQKIRYGPKRTRF